MPQMMPINWMISFIYVIMIFILFNIMNYYIFNLKFNNQKNTLNKIKFNNLTWKW